MARWLDEKAKMNDELPQVFAGDGGSASHVHVDMLPMVQMCHVLHGIKAGPNIPNTVENKQKQCKTM